MGVSECLYAQNNTFSPYSRYGIGDINNTAFTFQKGMANVGIALPLDTTAPVFINNINPASLGMLKFANIETGGYYLFSDIRNKSNVSAQFRSANFNYLSVAFPIRHFSGLAFGLMPYSATGYQINQVQTLSGVGDVNYQYTGSGGLNKVYMAYGISLYKFIKDKNDSSKHIFRTLIKNMSFGVNAYYLFGNITQTSMAIYPNSAYYYNFADDRSLRITGMSADIGVQTSIPISKNKSKYIGFGLLFSNPSKLNVTYDYLAYNFAYNYYGQKALVDTVSYINNNAGKLKLPISYGVGIGYFILNKMGINLDVKYTDWSKYYLITDNANVKNAFEFNLGGYYQPDRFSSGKGNYWGKVIYRLGVSYNTGYQEYNGTAVPLMMGTTGLSLPVGLYRAFSALHISFQYGLKGNASTLLKENIFRVNLGVTLNDRWFIKYKYD